MIPPLSLFAVSCDQSFLGLNTWYHYLPAGDYQSGTCNIEHFHFLGNDIPLVLLAVVDDLLVVAGIVAVGFVVYGGIQFIASQGSPDGTAKAQTTVINALIGLAVAIVAIALVSYLGSQLGS